MARSAERTAKLSLAALAQNKAALIASDCGVPDLARTLCWRHAEVFLGAQPLSAQEARYALEPVVNLARLLVRDGDGSSAYRVLEDLVHAAKSGGRAEVDGHTVRFENLTATQEDHHQLHRWLWTVLLADGIRALVTAGEWERARAQARQHRGIGTRLLDGRQVEIVGRCLAGDPADAHALLNSSVTAEPWERPVASCLAILCQHQAGKVEQTTLATMVQDYLSLDTPAELDLFRTRVGLAALDLSELDPAHTSAITDRLLTEAAGGRNGYTAREVLAHPTCRERLEPATQRALRTALSSSGLGQGHIPTYLEQDLLHAAEHSATTAQHLLAHRQTADHST
ncbi:hypothetical protein [Streptomyces daliensis]